MYSNSPVENREINLFRAFVLAFDGHLCKVIQLLLLNIIPKDLQYLLSIALVPEEHGYEVLVRNFTGFWVHVLVGFKV